MVLTDQATCPNTHPDEALYNLFYGTEFGCDCMSNPEQLEWGKRKGASYSDQYGIYLGRECDVNYNERNRNKNDKEKYC